ncbi:beta-lactamase/transpeptidase-like protein [Aspergillus taichungensis]|uniref:Beta-lactamase/transpeptidase-like protein n=1 Tax=Aspergillus taichungensis TaxID=482145 RepID=A0A2J5I0S2_9EURO|nr:beta-lactamase/transpeptidase-like protein [Aspergillus taichungensis]
MARLMISDLAACDNMDNQAIQRILEIAPSIYRGPGGSIAVLKDGERVAQHAWGYANLEERIPMTSSTLMPICSITKQMVCMVLKDLERNPTPEMAARGPTHEQLSASFRRILRPEITESTGLRLEHLCHMQSGIRDYWAMTMFWGTTPEGKFIIPEHADQVIARTTSLHFPPGSQYSYSNLNFHVLARVLEDVSGQPLGELLRERLFMPAQMATARLGEDTAKLPSPCEGYEGSESSGFVRAINRMQWSGDAGVVATLTDMIEYERYLDQSWADPQSIYQEIAKPPCFANGNPASYGYGLGHGSIGGFKTIGHGGALRGYRLHRLHVPSERLSVVVMLNSEVDAKEMATYVVKEVLHLPKTLNPAITPIDLPPSRTGTFFDPDAQMALELTQGGQNRITISYAISPETLALVDPQSARSETLRVALHDNSIELHRITDNRVTSLRRVAAAQEPPQGQEYTGRYSCGEIDSTFHCTGTGGMLYGSFDGFLGHGPVYPMRYLGEDLWLLAYPRGLDAPAPGHWTLAFQRGAQGTVVGVTMSCWLARKVVFTRS